MRNTNVEIRQQLILPMRVFLRKTFSRPLRFSGIDSSAPLVRRMASFFIVGGGERVELSFIIRSSVRSDYTWNNRKHNCNFRKILDRLKIHSYKFEPHIT